MYIRNKANLKALIAVTGPVILLKSDPNTQVKSAQFFSDFSQNLNFFDLYLNPLIFAWSGDSLTFPCLLETLTNDSS